MPVSRPEPPEPSVGPVPLWQRVAPILFLVMAMVAGVFFISPVPARADAASIVVSVDDDTVSGFNWHPGDTVKIMLEAPGGGGALAVGTTVNGAGEFSVDVGAAGADIVPGYTIEATSMGGTEDRTLTVSHVSVARIDSRYDTVRGRGTDYAPIYAWIEGHMQTAWVPDIVDGSGRWSVDFDGIWDIAAGTRIRIREYDADWDATEILAVAPMDSDGDGIDDVDDNCVWVWNTTQYDGDGDGVGAICDDVDRLWGTNRYGTAAAVSRATLDGAGEVFIALGTNFPDALVAAAAGGARHAPVLLTNSTSLPSETAAELGRLSPATAYIVGGTAVISPAVEQQVRDLVPTVTRLAGANRYETSAAVSSALFPSASTAFVALGTNFPDALVAAAAGGARHAPVLLTNPTSLPPETAVELGRLSPAKIYIVGGSAAISPAVEQELSVYGQVERLAGSDRYGTAAAVSEAFFGAHPTVFLAYGGNFPDALVAGAAGGYMQGPVLLVTHDAIPPATRHEIDRYPTSHILLVGGSAVIGDPVFDALP